MEMSMTTVCYIRPLHEQLLTVFLVLWPFITLIFLKRGKSPMPLLASLLPFALATTITWLELAQVVERMALSGGELASTAAGIAEALVAPVVATGSAAVIALFALIRRSVPAGDHYTVVFALSIATEVVAALLFVAFIDPVARQVYLALIWAATSLLIALAIVARMVVLSRRNRAIA